MVCNGMWFDVYNAMQCSSMPWHATQCNACMSKCVYMCVLAAAKNVLNGPERSRRPACFVVMWFCEMADGRLGYKLFLTSMLLCTCGFPDEHIVGRRWEILSCKERCLQMFAVIWNTVCVSTHLLVLVQMLWVRITAQCKCDTMGSQQTTDY